MKASDVYYDPYDFEIDRDPYPVWRRLREEAPLYYNDKHGFYALSRFDDVEKGLTDWKTYSSAKGMLLEIIKAVVELGVEIPPGNTLFEDPPIHDVHRSILSRVFTPKKMLAVEPEGEGVLCQRTGSAGWFGRIRLHPRPGCTDADADDRNASRHSRGGPGGDQGCH